MEFDAIEEKERLRVKKKKNWFAKREKSLVSDVYPVVSMPEEGILELLFNGETFYMAILACKSYDLYFLDEHAENRVINGYWDLHQRYTKSLKEIYTTILEDNKKQQEYYMHKIEVTTDPTHLYYLQVELDHLKYIESAYMKQSTYPCIFGESIKELKKNFNDLKRITGSFLDVHFVNAEETKKILYGMNNRFGGKYNSDSIVNGIQDIVEATKPQGGISFKHEAYNVTGDGCSACVHVIGKPNILNSFWLDELVRKNDTFALVDSLVLPDIDYKKIIDDSIEETIAQTAKAPKQTERDKLYEETQHLRMLYAAIDTTGEVVKNVHIRFFLRENSLERLQDKVDEVMKDLEGGGFNATVFLDEQKEEWQSIFLPFDKQLELPASRQGLSFPAEALGVGFGYNQTNLSDPSAKYYGYTSSGGTVYWDIFHKTTKRLSYNSILLGDMGSGKSTLLKSITKDNLIKGNYVRGFDKSGELDKLVREFNGKKINLDGSDGSINMLQIFPTSTANPKDLADVTIDEEASINMNISLLGKKYATYNQEATSNEITTFTSKVRAFYRSCGIIGPNAKPLMERSNEEFPILEELREFMKREQEHADDFERNLLASIVLNLSSMVDSYGSLFNRHTSVPNLGEQQFVIFDINSLSNMEERIFDIQFFSAMTLIQQNCMMLGRKEKYAFDNKLKNWWDLKRSLIINDECHNTLNVNKLTALEMYIILMSEGRKFFIGLLNATQKADRLYPEMTNISDKSVANAASKLREIIGLSQYKIILKQDPTSLPMLKKVFGDTFTEAEYARVPSFETSSEGSQGILSISGDQNLQMSFEVSREDIALFDGGA